jgi:hypothetical protein
MEAFTPEDLQGEGVGVVIVPHPLVGEHGLIAGGEPSNIVEVSGEAAATHAGVCSEERAPADRVGCSF